MEGLFLCGGARYKCLEELINSKLIQLQGVVIPISYENKVKRVIKVAVSNDIPVFKIKRDELLKVVSKLKPDLLISVGYPYLIEKKILELVKYAINVHPTLLPKYRGYRSGPYIIINGEEKTGVTVHFIDEGIDSGDIIVQKEIPLSKFDTVKSMMRKTSEIEGKVLCEAIKRLLMGNFKVIKQDETQATLYTYKRTLKDSFIDWNKSLKELYNEIRACDPEEYPAYFYVDGQKVCIKLWRPHKSKNERDMI